MSKVGVVVFGNVPLATWVVDILQNQHHVDYLSVVCTPTRADYSHHALRLPGLFEYAQENNLLVHSHGNFMIELPTDIPLLGISCRYPKIFTKDQIQRFDFGIINLHGGELPRYRGVNVANHVILEGMKTAAGTLHYIDTGIDTGDIISRSYFEVGEFDTAYDVFLYIQAALQRVFKENISDLLTGKYLGTSQDEFIRNGEKAATYKSDDLDRFRILSGSLPTAENLRRIRAFSFPGHPPAFWEIQGHRVFSYMDSAEKPGGLK